ncbi:MAG: hypothetical protein ACD_62C00267G0003 [uncultured bacterium]|nr:MAG: hypothetical protein ACD_62C00267G0003 [uncultured bacterium]HLD43898.1 CRISPR-associated endonuclease Cas2 [bacterium]
MIYVLTYDIAFDSVDDKKAQRRLRKLSKVLENYGWRRQRSIFEFDVDSAVIHKIEVASKKILDLKRDSLRIYPLCVKCLKRSVVQGIGEKIELKDFVIV